MISTEFLRIILERIFSEIKYNSCSRTLNGGKYK